jgi:hypothetical protein
MHSLLCIVERQGDIMDDMHLIHEVGHAKSYLEKIHPDVVDDLPILFLDYSEQPPGKELLSLNGYQILLYRCSFEKLCEYMENVHHTPIDLTNCHAFCICPSLIGTEEESKKNQIFISKGGYNARRDYCPAYRIVWIVLWILFAFIVCFGLLLHNVYSIVCFCLISFSMWLMRLYFHSTFGYGFYRGIWANKESDAAKIHYLKHHEFYDFYDKYPNYYREAKDYTQILDEQILGQLHSEKK